MDVSPSDRHTARRMLDEHRRLCATLDTSYREVRSPSAVSELLSVLAFDHHWMRRQLQDVVGAPEVPTDASLDPDEDATRLGGTTAILARLEQRERALASTLDDSRAHVDEPRLQVLLDEHAEHTRTHLRKLHRMQDSVEQLHELGV